MMKLPRYPRLRRFALAATVLLGCQPTFAAKHVERVLGNSADENAASLPKPASASAVLAATRRDAAPRPRAPVGAASQIVCTAHYCRPVQPGCRIHYYGGSPRDGSGGNVEVCY